MRYEFRSFTSHFSRLTFLTFLLNYWLNYGCNNLSIIHYQLKKNNSMKKIITGLFAIAAFTFSAVAQDQKTDVERKLNKERHGMHKGGEGKGMRGMENLNLTETQRQQIKSINEDFTTRLRALNQNDNLLVKDMKAQRKALMQERKDKISAILTPEQKTQFAQLQKQHGERNKGEWKNKTKGEDWKQKRKMEDGKGKVKVKTT